MFNHNTSLSISKSVKGHDIKTIINNFSDICDSLKVSQNILSKYIGMELDCKTNGEIIIGEHDVKELSDCIDSFVSILVLCQACNQPTCTIIKKERYLFTTCTSCGNMERIHTTHKIINYILKQQDKASVMATLETTLDVNDVASNVASNVVSHVASNVDPYLIQLFDTLSTREILNTINRKVNELKELYNNNPKPFIDMFISRPNTLCKVLKTCFDEGIISSECLIEYRSKSNSSELEKLINWIESR